MSRGVPLPRRMALVGLLLTLVVSGTACGARRRASRVPDRIPPAGPPPVVGETTTGLASWYGDPHHGRPTASGEIYDMNAFTAAHRTFPFHTWVRVTSLENNLSTTVRINDRGPFIDGRIIDLSRAAAGALDMMGSGTALVRLEVVKYPEAAATGGRATDVSREMYTVQVGAFLVEKNAMLLQAELVKEYGDVFIQTVEAPEGTYYRVRVGRLASYEEAEDLAHSLRNHPDVTSAFVVRLD